MDFFAGFSQWQPLGNNYEGGLLTPPAKTAIHFTHRLGAIVTLLVLGWFGLKYALTGAQKTKVAACYFILALIVQFILGVLMVWSGINIYLATAHNGFAALLVLSFINLFYVIKQRSR
jgi:cytochrome c oxidase assembly protein subunit 15